MKAPTAPTLLFSNVSIRNLAIDPRTDVTMPTRAWSPVAVPFSATAPELADFVPHGSSERRLAVRARNVGTHSTIYFVCGVWSNPQTLGDLMTRASSTMPAFAPSDWVADDMTALIPKFEITFMDDKSEILEPKSAVLVENTAAHQVFRLSYSLRGHRVVVFATVLSGQDTVEISGFYQWMDQTVPEWEAQVKGIAMISGEYFAQDFAARSGSFEPINFGGKWRTYLFTNVAIGDAQALPFFGRMLCLPQYGPGQSPVMLEDQQLRIQTLLAQKLAPLQGIAAPDAWAGKFLSFKVPMLAPQGRSPQADAFIYEVASREWFKFAGSITDPRPEGLAPAAGQTGGQFDFGAVKGWPAIAGGNAYWIHQAKFSVAEFLRGFMRYEADDSILRAAGHPNWLTWSMLTNERVSKDMLGKDRNRPYSYGTGWTGMDNQHRSQKLAAAYLALTGDPMVQELLEHAAETDLARDQNHTDAARAAGRLLMTWADFYTLVSEPTKSKILLCMTNYLKAYKNNRQGEGSIKVSETILDDRTGIVDENGAAKPCWSVWGESIAAMGFWAAYVVTGLGDFREIALDLCRSVIRNGIFLVPSGQWRVCTYVEALPNGASLPFDAYTLAPIGQARSITVGDGGWWTWTMPALLILAKQEGETTEEGLRAIEVIRQKLAGGPSDWNAAEWFACVDYSSLIGR